MATGTGNLPNQNMDFVPLAQLPAADLDKLVENIESLADGTGIGDDSIGTTQLAADAVETDNITDANVTPEKLSVGYGDYHFSDATLATSDTALAMTTVTASPYFTLNNTTLTCNTTGIYVISAIVYATANGSSEDITKTQRIVIRVANNPVAGEVNARYNTTIVFLKSQTIISLTANDVITVTAYDGSADTSTINDTSSLRVFRVG